MLGPKADSDIGACPTRFVPPTIRSARCSVEMIWPFWRKTVRFQLEAIEFGPPMLVEHLLLLPSKPFQQADCTFVLASLSQM